MKIRNLILKLNEDWKVSYFAVPQNWAIHVLFLKTTLTTKTPTDFDKYVTAD